MIRALFVHLARGVGLAVLCAAALVLFRHEAASAGPQSIEEIANYAGPDRTAILEAGARKEGEVLIYTSGTVPRSTETYAKMYPFLKMQLFRGDAPVLARRMIEEYNAGKHLVDAINTNTGGLQPLRAAGFLQAFTSPDAGLYRKEAIEPNRLWVFDYQSFLSLGYNTAAISENEVPKTLDDLLDPKWQGKMAFPGTSTLPNWIGAVLMDKGDKAQDYLLRLAQQKIAVYEISGRAVANLIVSGEVPLSPSTFRSHMANSKSQGASVGWRPLDGVYSNVSGVAVAKKSPHPFAAMLYVDLILSREGQLINQSFGYSSLRTDLENPEQPTKVYYLTERPDYNQEYEQWSELSRKIFGKGSQQPAK